MLNLIMAFESHLNLLDDNSKVSSQKEISDKSSENIRSILSYLHLRKLHKNTLQNLDFLICNQCGVVITPQMKPNSITLPCKHTICSSSCLAIIQKFSTLKSRNLSCLECLSEIPSSFLQNLPTIKSSDPELCEICLLSFAETESIKLNCGHQFNLNCIQSYIEYLISNFGVSDFKVGCPKCEIPIEEVFIKGIIDKEKFEKYKMIVLKNILKDDEEPLAISNENCGEFDEFDVFSLDFLLDCGYCKRENCFYSQFVLAKRDKQLDEEFQIVAKTLGYKTCPNCGSMCEKTSGCKFMKCFSPKCKGKHNFCYLCSKEITDAQHYSHYKAKGPFGDICNTMDGTPE